MLTPKHKDIWTGKYHGIAYEIVCWTSYDGKPIWNYYLVLNGKQIPAEHASEFVLELSPADEYSRRSYPYMTVGVLRDIDWHGGITFYSKEFSDDQHLIVRAGCDYAHLWDEGQSYSIEEVFAECRRTIESLWDAAPYLLVWCDNKGCYKSPKDGQFRSDDGFVCNECQAKIDEGRKAVVTASSQ